jgi:hypothetical protein
MLRLIGRSWPKAAQAYRFYHAEACSSAYSRAAPGAAAEVAIHEEERLTEKADWVISEFGDEPVVRP